MPEVNPPSTVLPWPELPPPDAQTLLDALRQLLGMIRDGEVHAVDCLDDLFARVVAALAELLELHLSAGSGPPGQDTADAHTSQVVQIVHEYLNQPLTLLWWHLLRTSDDPSPHLDDVAIWTNTDPAGQRREYAHRLWPRIVASATAEQRRARLTPGCGGAYIDKAPQPRDAADDPDTTAS